MLINSFYYGCLLPLYSFVLVYISGKHLGERQTDICLEVLPTI